jgi:tyrosine decarboxylase/aspartate 1-decarboxylase
MAITQHLIVTLILVLAVAWVFGALFARFGLPVILGEMIAGFILGPAVLGVVTTSEPLELMAEFGIFFGMFFAGMEMDPKELIEHIWPSLGVAVGGFVLPFLENSPKFDFTVSRVSSIASDPHKMGMATIPSGAFLVRERDWIRKIHKDAPYLDMLGQLSALSGTRSSAAVAATYAAMRSLGREGYAGIVKQCMDVTGHALKRAMALGLEPVMEPMMNILCLYVPEPRSIQKKLDERGWKVSVAQNPESLRLVIMPHVTRESIDGLFAELEELL